MQSLDISLSLYFFYWIEYLFIKTFPYHMILRLWDIFFVRGEVFLYEIALGIIKIQEKDILNVYMYSPLALSKGYINVPKETAN